MRLLWPIILFCAPTTAVPFASFLLFADSDDNTFHCSPCSLPLGSSLLLVRGTISPRCVHPGQPIARWPVSQCPSLPLLRSVQVSLDRETGLLLAERRRCFAERDQIGAELRCSGPGQQWQGVSFRVLPAPRPPREQRRRRWLQRRNPRHSRIHFREDKYVVELAEDTPLRTPLVRVQAHHEAQQPLYYAFSAPEDARSANMFQLDTETGEVRLAKALDRETLARHVLKVSAYERLDPSQSALVALIVDVLDVQDNAPLFERSAYYAEIREDAPIGTTVLSVFARDFDEGPNGEVQYSLADQEGGEQGVAGLFSINAHSGVVQTAAPLDHESLPPVLRLRAVAADRGEPPMRSSANLEIGVLDVNDNAPLFEHSAEQCQAEVAEDAPLPAVVLRPRASDADSGANGKVHFSIVSASAPLFSIDYESGEVTLKERASPIQSPLSLVGRALILFTDRLQLIRAKDGGQAPLSSTLACTVRVRDVNDHAPAFFGVGQEGLELLVDEDAPVGQELTRVLAVDEDSGPNGELHYRLEAGEGQLPFELDPDSGVLRTREKLDRELRAEYAFRVLVSDGGVPVQNASLEVRVRVKDVNDNAPMFARPLVELELDEDTPRGTELVTLRATDADETEQEQKLVYRIEGVQPADAAQMFALSAQAPGQGAILSLARPFAPAHREFLVDVVAQDRGGLRALCQVLVQVRDVNRAPHFSTHPFLVRVPENAPIGAAVAKLEAKDEDRGENARLTFAIVGQESSKFSIDSQSGLITVRAPLDRESQAVHTLSVRVQDAGSPLLQAETSLEVVLEDVNDNGPRFGAEQYHASIPEDIPVGTSFLQVQAQDPDEGANGLVDYFLDAKDPFVRMDRFRLDRTSGTLRVNAPLDRENVSEFLLPVIARDRGSPLTLSERSLIRVHLEDVNDNAPAFEMPSYDLYVPENAPTGTLVGHLRAQDADLAENGRVQFRILGGADAKLFELDEGPEAGTVRLRTRTQFDYEASQNKFQVEVQAASGQLSSSVPVRVHVLDANDHAPQLADPFLVLVAHLAEEHLDPAGGERAPQNLTVGPVPAFDPDQNGTLRFGTAPGGLLTLDPDSGVMGLGHFGWDRQIDAEQRICATDGPNTVCADARVQLVPVTAALLRSSAVSVLLDGVRRDEFLSAVPFGRFIQAMATLWEWTGPEHIRVFGVQRQPNGEDVAVSLFVAGPEGTSALSARRVEEALVEQGANLSALFGSPVRPLRDDLCAREPCPYFERCRAALKYLRTEQTLSTDDFLLRALATARTFECECPPGFSTNRSLEGRCNQRLDQCFEGPCLHGGTCLPLENGFRCECPPGRDGGHSGQSDCGAHCEFAVAGVESCWPGFCHSGAVCRLEGTGHGSARVHRMACAGCPWRPADTDRRCRLRAISLGGDSHVAVPKAPSRLEWTLSLSFATISADGTLIFAGNTGSDFLHLYLEGALPKVRFSLGSNETWSASLPDAKGNRVNDGQWHTLRVEYAQMRLRLWLDDCDAQSALALGAGAQQCAVQVQVRLAQRCVRDAAVPCHRFLDLPQTMLIGGVGAAEGESVRGIGSFVGALRDVSLDGQLVHFSEWTRIEREGQAIWAGSAKYRPDNCAHSPCPEQTRCVDRWLGHLCRCALRVHSSQRGCAPLQAGQEPPALTLADDAFVVWGLPSGTAQVPFSLSFEFRTRERKTQVITLEFEQSTQLLVFSLESGQSLVGVNGEQYLLPYPPLSDGDWHSVEAHFSAEALRISVDVLYSKRIPLAALSRPRALHSGTVPSSARPAPFVGCLRNVEWNAQRLAVAEQSGTRPGCLAPNLCQLAQTQCPDNSRCVRDWDRHVCKCHSGYAGDSCVDVCSLRGICGPEGVCTRSANTTAGYECICPEGSTGPNCERPLLPKECPFGWFGRFPRCRRCNCPKGAGFEAQCNGTSGECICREGSFRSKDSGEWCVPCDCGYGVAPGTGDRCDPLSGQCPCVGDAVGRQCDRCGAQGGPPMLLERRSLKCVVIQARCPSEMAVGIQWPTSAEGTIARQSCPHGMMGVATRGCAMGAQWLPVDSSNCTLAALFELQNGVERALQPIPGNSFGDLMGLSWRLANVTAANRLQGRNVQIAVGLLGALIEAEAVANGILSAESERFTRNLLQTADSLLARAQMDAQQFRSFSTFLAKYGAFLAELHNGHSYLRRLRFIGAHLIFCVEPLQLPVQLPRFLASGRSPPRLRLRANPEQTVTPNAPPLAQTLFHMATKQSESPFTVGLYLSGGGPNTLRRAILAVPIAGHMDRVSAPEDPSVLDPATHHCAAMRTDQAQTGWSTEGVREIGVNGTHLECELPFGTEQTALLIAALGGSSGITFPFGAPLPHGAIPLVVALCQLFAFALLLIAFCVALLRCGRRRSRLLRLSVVSVFALNAASLQMAQRAQFPAKPLCAARNAVLSLSTSALFSWLFLFALHLFKVLTGQSARQCSFLSIALGLGTPLLLAIGEFLASAMQQACATPPDSVPFCLLAVPPIALCLLAFYTLAASWILSWNKQYDATVSRLALRRTLLGHSVLVLLCAVQCAFAVFSSLFATPSASFAAMNALLFAFASVHVLLWATMLAPEQSIDNCYGGNDSKSAESLWMARELEFRRQAQQHHSLLMCPDSGVPEDDMSPFHRTDRKTTIEGKVYEGIPNEWIPPAEAGSDCGEPTYLHHTLQRSLETNFPRILSPAPRHPAPNSMLDVDWPSTEMPPRHLAAHTCSATESPLRQQQMEPNGATPTGRRRTQPIQLGGPENGGTPNGSIGRASKFGGSAALDDELNCAYLTFTRRKQMDAVQRHQHPNSAQQTTFN